MASKNGERFRANEEAWEMFRAECEYRGIPESKALAEACRPGRIAEAWARMGDPEFMRGGAPEKDAKHWIKKMLASERTAREWVNGSPSEEGAVAVIWLWALVSCHRAWESLKKEVDSTSLTPPSDEYTRQVLYAEEDGHYFYFKDDLELYRELRTFEGSGFDEASAIKVRYESAFSLFVAASRVDRDGMLTELRSLALVLAMTDAQRKALLALFPNFSADAGGGREASKIARMLRDLDNAGDRLEALLSRPAPNGAGIEKD